MHVYVDQLYFCKGAARINTPFYMTIFEICGTHVLLSNLFLYL